MKRTIITIGIILGAAVACSLTALAAEDGSRAGNPAQARASDAPAPVAARSAVDAATPPPVTAGGNAVQAAPAENAFAVEKIVIILGLTVVIGLAVFRWGSGSSHRQQEK